uniref:GMP phosphodiesterase delta subunit domain-containing protein n=1 Tax=Stegastes partitus TaxID=144197 RepID=A0A3B5BAF7_9TELE
LTGLKNLKPVTKTTNPVQRHLNKTIQPNQILHHAFKLDHITEACICFQRLETSRGDKRWTDDEGERGFFPNDTGLPQCFPFKGNFPNSRNTCEHIYEFPQLPDDLIRQTVERPHETRSDSLWTTNSSCTTSGGFQVLELLTPFTLSHCLFGLQGSG